MVMVLIKVSTNYIFILISKVYYFQTARTVTVQMCVVRIYIRNDDAAFSRFIVFAILYELL